MDDLPRHGEPPAPGDVGLHHIDFAALNECAKAPFGRFMLATGNQSVHRRHELRISVVVLRVQQLFHKKGTIRFKAADQCDGFLGGSADVPARINQQITFIPEPPPRGLNYENIPPWIFAKNAPAKLHRRKALFDVSSACFFHCRGLGPKEGAGVCSDFISVTAPQELIEGFPDGFPYDVPQRDVDARNHLDRRAASAIINRGHVHLLPQPFDFKRVFPDQYVLQTLEAWHGTPRRRFHDCPRHVRLGFNVRVTGNSGVGRHLDDGKILYAISLLRALRSAVAPGGLKHHDFHVANFHASLRHSLQPQVLQGRAVDQRVNLRDLKPREVRAFNHSIEVAQRIHRDVWSREGVIRPKKQLVQHAIFLDAMPSAKSRYIFTFSLGTVINGQIMTYTINADPISRGTTGTNSYYIDQTGVIRQNPTTLASAADSPLDE